MKSKRAKNPTKAERRRFDVICREIGCVPCRMGGLYRQGEANHILKGYRIGHGSTVPECEWHHRGVIPAPCKSAKVAAEVFGPSRAINRRAFRDLYGTDEQLLAITARLVEEFEATVI